MVKEFREFILKGNVVDLAVGVVIGGAFGKIVTSLVNDIIMPVVGLFIGGVSFTNLKYVIHSPVIENGQIIKEEVAITYGIFIQNIVDFIIIGFCIFLFVKAINSIRRPKVEEVVEAKPTTEELLTDIRNLLKEK